MFRARQQQLGFSLVELLIVLALTVTIFAGLFASVQYSLKLVSNSGAKLSALSLANDRMEYFRSLPYSDVGTVSGIPAGLIPQNSTTTLNGIEFAERVLVEYVDDPADGQLTATTTDSNGIPADYKRLKIELSWTINNSSDSISLISNIVPRSIETTAGGGTVRVNVLEADATMLSGAEVRLFNNSTAPVIDVTRYTDASGIALFSGAPAASNYEVTVTAAGYSTDQTYEATTTNPNPITSPFSVLESDISTVTFQIGELSDIDIATYSAITDTAATKLFTDNSDIAASTSVAITAGSLVLNDTAGVYDAGGTAFLTNIAPSSLSKWDSVVVVGDAPIDTVYIVNFYTGTTSAYTLIPEIDLPGNNVGFTNSIIDLSTLEVATYPDITAAITLTTSNTAITPSIEEVSIYYREAETTRNNVGLSIQGNKTIGSELDATPIYKTDIVTTTDGGGRVQLSNIEFDTYQIVNTDGYTLARACPQIPLIHEAGIDSTVDMLLTSGGANTLRVSVVTDGGDALPGAAVLLTRSGFNDTQITDNCGQVFFSAGVTANPDFVLTVSRTGYSTEVTDPYDIAGNSNTNVIVSEL